jgi:hypothetical protein
MTQSLRVATFSHLNKLGEDVLVETDLKTKLCRHGETSSTIRNWLQFEAKARTECQTPPPVPAFFRRSFDARNVTQKSPRDLTAFMQ